MLPVWLTYDVADAGAIVFCTQMLRVWLTYDVADAVASVVMADAACVVDI